MKILKPGLSPEERKWKIETKCTGAGNGGRGCNALLEVSEDDLFQTASHHYDGSSDYYITFKCAACGTLTDLPESKVPTDIRVKAAHRKSAPGQ